MKFFLKAFLEDPLTYTNLLHKIFEGNFYFFGQKMIFFSETFWCLLVYQKKYLTSLYPRAKSMREMRQWYMFQAVLVME